MSATYQYFCFSCPKVDNSGLVSPEGKADPSKLGDMKRISTEAWNMIVKEYGEVEGNVALDAGQCEWPDSYVTYMIRV
jgi:hypothetical protein